MRVFGSVRSRDTASFLVTPWLQSEPESFAVVVQHLVDETIAKVKKVVEAPLPSKSIASEEDIVRYGLLWLAFHLPPPPHPIPVAPSIVTVPPHA